MGGFLTVIEDSSGPIAPVVIPFAGTFLPTVAFSLPGDFGVSTCTAIENPVPPGYSNATGELCTNQLIVEGEETTCTLVNVNSQNAVQVPALPEWS